MRNVKIEMEKYASMCESLFSRLDEVLKDNNELRSRVRDLEEKMDGMNELSSATRIPSFNEETYRELEDRHRRRKFLVISGIEEPCNGSPAERSLEEAQVVEDLAHKIGVQDIKVSEVLRVGSQHSQKPRLLRVKCSSMVIKSSLLRSAKNLRKFPEYRKVYINPDLTQAQRQVEKSLRAELASRRRAGERVMIRAGRIIELHTNPRPDSTQNFRQMF